MESPDDFNIETYLTGLTSGASSHSHPLKQFLSESPSGPSPLSYHAPPGLAYEQSYADSLNSIPNSYTNEALSFQLPSFLLGATGSMAGGSLGGLSGSMMSPDIRNWMAPSLLDAFKYRSNSCVYP